MISVNYLNVTFCNYLQPSYTCIWLLRRRRRCFLMELLAVLCVCGWPVHVPSARNWEEVVGVSSKSAPSLKHHNSIHHAHCVPVPSAFRYLWIFASSIFSFLNLSYNVKGWSGMYSLFLELLRCLMSKLHILSYCWWDKTGAYIRP